MQVATEIVVEQGTDEWFNSRLGRATASHFADIMANGRGGGESAGSINYRAQLVAERTSGQKAETYKSKEMQWGNDMEPLARLKYVLQSGNDVRESGFFAHNDIHAGASPDGLIGEDGAIEIKCPNTATHIETLKKQSVPTQYLWQIQGQLWMTGRKWCDFISHDPRLPGNASLFVKRVMRDDDKIAELEKKVREFLQKVDEETELINNYGK